MKHATHDGAGSMPMSHYRRLLLMAALHFAAMYLLMYAMVDVRNNVIHNLNQVYMAGLMTAAMIVIELPLMSSMYRRRKLNVLIMIVGLAALIASFSFIRRQVAIADRQFLKSMIPHHAAAILMCEEASITRAEIDSLCASIITGQQSEIDQMKAMLDD
jgi:uncharacterized protein (DUF305 family)